MSGTLRLHPVAVPAPWDSRRVAPSTDARPIRRVCVVNLLWQTVVRGKLRRCSAGGLGALGQDGSSWQWRGRWPRLQPPARRQRWCVVSGNTGGDSVAGGNTGGGALGQDEVVIYIPGGLRTRCCPCPILSIYLSIYIYIYIYTSMYLFMSICINLSIIYMYRYLSIYIYISLSRIILPSLSISIYLSI